MHTPPTHIYVKQKSIYRKLTLNDILDELERPSLSGESEDSDEDKWSEMAKERGRQDLYIMPGDDDAMADKDYGEDDRVDISNLPSTQLTGFAVMKS